MSKVQFSAVFWTLLLAIPLTALAISITAYLTEHLVEIGTTIMVISRETSISARGWILEFAERWPEVAGMIIGQLVIMTILIFARRKELAENRKTN
jgi:hypothetical protein